MRILLGPSCEGYLMASLFLFEWNRSLSSSSRQAMNLAVFKFFFFFPGSGTTATIPPFSKYVGYTCSISTASFWALHASALIHSTPLSERRHQQWPPIFFSAFRSEGSTSTLISFDRRRLLLSCCERNLPSTRFLCFFSLCMLQKRWIQSKV